jgi:hypothetical protein
MAKVNGFTYFSLKIKDNRIRGVTIVSKTVELYDRPVSQGLSVLTFTAVEISVYSQPLYSQVMYVWYINVSTSHLYFLHFSCALF